MIGIYNVTKAEPYGKGKREYEVRINSKVIARFEHVREEGLAECLRKAAEAVEKEEHCNSERIFLQKLRTFEEVRSEYRVHKASQKRS